MSRTGHDRRGCKATWDAAALRDPHRQVDKAARVERMFNAIAPTYERVNTVASFGRDIAWRNRTVEAAAVRSGDVVLDVCCGTGDMLRVFAVSDPAPAIVVGIDFADQMLERSKLDGVEEAIQLIRADALRLPLADASVDVVSCVFGVRNFGDLQAGLCEMSRVARPGARLVILEFATPRNFLLRWVYGFYCDHVLPRLAAAISHDRTGAYRYLPRSIRTFETALTMVRRLEDAGFREVHVRPMNLGGVVLYRAVRPGPIVRPGERGR